jgi:hypothetical protein
MDFSEMPPIPRWRVKKISTYMKSDVAILSLLPIKFEEKFRQRFIRLTTRVPKITDIIFCAGVRQRNVDYEKRELTFSILASCMRITEFFPHGRDRIILPEMAFHGDGLTLGGMSGGPAVDSSGHVFGIVSSGLSLGARRGITGISALVPSLTRHIVATLPDSIREKGFQLADYPSIEIVGRDFLEITKERQWRLSLW